LTLSESVWVLVLRRFQLDSKLVPTEGGYRIVVGSGGIIGGGGGQQQSSPVEVPNNLRSRDDAVLLYLLGEGEIEGAASGDILRDIFFDETPIKNADGTLNFSNFVVDFRNGTPNQSFISGIADAVQSEKSVSVQIKASLGSVTRTINNQNCNAIKVKLMVPSLLQQDDKGNINNTEVRFRIEVSTQGGSFVNLIETSFSGKVTSAYQREYRFNVSTTGPWDVRITRLTPDSTDTKLQNSLFWQSFTEIIDQKLSYPYSGLLGVRISAEQFQSLPRTAIRLKHARLLIPHNYNPATRAYAGIFNGSMTTAYSNNPAWVFYDMLINNRYGCGRFIDTSQVDVFALYSIGQYCDELVPNGLGGFEPRFTCNAYIQNADDAYKILEAIASCFRGMFYESSGIISAIQDKPSDPVRIYTKANVVCEYDDSGNLTSPPFSYSGTSLETRYTVALVSYLDPTDFFREKIEPVEDEAAIARYGYNPIRITAFGCTSRSQAYRLGKWTLLSNQRLTQTIAFKVGAEGRIVNPGEVFKVIDPLKTLTRRGGRIVSATTTAVTIDSAIAIESGKIYTLSVVKSDGSLEARTVNNAAGDHTVLTVSSAFSETPIHIWILESNDLQALLFKCVAVSEVDGHLYEIIGTEYNASIYNAVEQNIKFEEPDVSGYPDPKIPPESPQSITVSEGLYETNGGSGIRVRVDFSWNASPSSYIKEYRAEYKRTSRIDYAIAEITENLSTEIIDPEPGIYQFRVRAINQFGSVSRWTEIQQEVYGFSAPPSNVTGFQIIPYNYMASLFWDLSPDLDVRIGGHYKIKHTPSKTNVSWSDGIELLKVPGNSTSCQVNFLDGTYLIKAVDLQGNQSNAAAQIVVSNFAQIETFNAIAESVESPDFGGEKENVVVIENALRLSSLELFDLQLGTFDDYPGLFDDAGASLSTISPGYYYFENPIDLGDVYVSRASASLSSLVVTEGQYFDSAGGFFDSAGGFFDGEDDDSSFAEMQISTSQNGVDYSDWQKFIIGDYKARSFKFRVKLVASAANRNVYVNTLSAIVDAPDRLESGNSTTSSSANTSVVFSNAFRNTPEIGITIQNGVTGDVLDLISKSESNFVINVRNSSNNRVVRDISYIAKGYGKKV